MSEAITGKMAHWGAPAQLTADEDTLSRARSLVSELERVNTAEDAEIIRGLYGLCERSFHSEIVSLARESRRAGLRPRPG